LIQTSKYIISAAVLAGFLTMPTVSRGQVIVTDSIPKSKMIGPTMFRIGTELIAPITSVVGTRRAGWELQIETDVYRYLLVADFGNETWTFGDSTYNYRSSGYYYRFGVDANLIPRDRFGGSFNFGLRYARSFFDEELFGAVRYPQWGTSLADGKNENMDAQWFEITLGIKANVWKNLVLGYTLRLKAGLSLSEFQGLEPYRIPGYGISGADNFWGMSYYVSWQFNFRKKYMIPPKPKG